MAGARHDTIPSTEATSPAVPSIRAVTSNEMNIAACRLVDVHAGVEQPRAAGAEQRAERRQPEALREDEREQFPPAKPSAFSTASSRNRSRIAMLIVLAVTSTSVNSTTTAQMLPMRNLDFPHIDTNYI